ncbi:fungal-specific transcription factor domain-containing protein [Cadophora sp. MPI-SDFR-AT-0126]|nr:fungal-specific transcription factor domain-containing protein [Leotiomycetes sp. MPI-SDFR-AT-0126]
MAEDIEVLEKYLTAKPKGISSDVRLPYSVISDVPGKPIIYLSYSRRRKGLQLPIDPGNSQREIIDQILHPHQSEVIQLYFKHLHPCFPIVDKRTFLELWTKDPERISSTLVCDVYASALIFWRKSEVLRSHPRPDLGFVWNQAVKALQDDFMAPSISTIHSTLLDLTGRPILQISGNIVNAGRTITLAHSLGLHRDATGWKATEHEKNVRTNLWWGCLIQDHWSSLAHGTPPNIQRANYDVPLPTIDSLLSSSVVPEEQSNAGMTFIKLCSLSQILGSLLPLVYSLHINEKDATKETRRIQCSLDDWESDLPYMLNLGSHDRADRVNGSANLWFCFLSVKLLLCRVMFKISASSLSPMPEAKQYNLALLRDSASKLVEFVTDIHENQLQEFWLPHTAYLLVSAATILLRCIVESSDIKTKRDCILKLKAFQNRLQIARDTSGWDLAEFCLERCSLPIKQIAGALRVSLDLPDHDSSNGVQNRSSVVFTPTPSEPRATSLQDGSAPYPLDFFLPVDPWDIPWESMWDSNGGMFPQSF